MRKLLPILLFLLLGLPCSATTYYIANSGSDSNAGTTKASPLAHAPGMTNCTSTCAGITPAAGDKYILRGGDTWHYSSGTPSLPWNWTWSGTSGNCNFMSGLTSTCIYIGIDRTWFAASSPTFWVRPIITMDNALSTSTVGSCTHNDAGLTALNLQQGSVKYVVVDDLEFKGACYQGGGGQYIEACGDQVTLSNMYFHGWTRTSGAGDDFESVACGLYVNHRLLITDSVCDGSDSSLGTVTPGPGGATGYCYSGGTDYARDIFNRVSNGIEGQPFVVHDSRFTFLYEPVNGPHGNVVENLPNGTTFEPGNFYFYNNYIAHMNEGEIVELDPVATYSLYYYNNIVFDAANGQNCLIIASTAAGGTPGGNATAYVYNNTWDFQTSAQGGSGTCVTSVGTSSESFQGTINYQNNHFINYPGNVLGSVWFSANSSPPNSFTVADLGGELFQSEATANGQGYISANNYAPTSSTNSSVGNGNQNTLSCATFGTALCSGTTAGVLEMSEDGGKVAVGYTQWPVGRPVSAAWDSGAYLYGLALNATARTQAINPLIYGLYNGQGSGGSPDLTFAANIQIPMIRWGGDFTTNFNWQSGVDCSNNGADFFFLSGGCSSTVAGAEVDSIISTYRGAYSGMAPLVTVPINPWITSTNTELCSYTKVSVAGSPAYGTQDGYFGPAYGANPANNCGTGTLSGTHLFDSDIPYNYTPNSNTIQQGWITHLIGMWGSCASGTGVCNFQLDNEPGAWGGPGQTQHFDVNPTQPDYGTITTLGEGYASAIHTGDSTISRILGPCDFEEFGWIQNSPAGTNLFAFQYYLQQFLAYDTIHGVRTLTDLDEHYGIGDSSGVSNSFSQLRTYWDLTYLTGNSLEGVIGGPIAYIPRFQSAANLFYPGTKVSLSEYEIGHVNTLTDVLVETEALGIFGYYGMDLANAFDTPGVGSDPVQIENAWYFYRNYDGAGSMFGDNSIQSHAFNQANLSVYGSTRTSDGKLIAIVINKTPTAITQTLNIANFTPGTTAKTFVYSASNLSTIVPGSNITITNNTIPSYSYPGYSATLFEIPTSGGTPTANTPNCAPGTGTYTTGQTVVCTATSSGSHMCYTMDGSTPIVGGGAGCSHGTPYTMSLSISSTTTLKTVAGGTGYLDSPVNTNVYTFTGSATQEYFRGFEARGIQAH